MTGDFVTQPHIAQPLFIGLRGSCRFLICYHVPNSPSAGGGVNCPPYEIGGKLNVVKQGGALAGRGTPLSRYASLPPYFAGGTRPGNLCPAYMTLRREAAARMPRGHGMPTLRLDDSTTRRLNDSTTQRLAPAPTADPLRPAGSPPRRHPGSRLRRPPAAWRAASPKAL